MYANGNENSCLETGCGAMCVMRIKEWTLYNGMHDETDVIPCTLLASTYAVTMVIPMKNYTYPGIPSSICVPRDVIRDM